MINEDRTWALNVYHVIATALKSLKKKSSVFCHVLFTHLLIKVVGDIGSMDATAAWFSIWFYVPLLCNAPFSTIQKPFIHINGADNNRRLMGQGRGHWKEKGTCWVIQYKYKKDTQAEHIYSSTMFSIVHPWPRCYKAAPLTTVSPFTAFLYGLFILCLLLNKMYSCITSYYVDD